MQLTNILLPTAAPAGTASAYNISLYSKDSYQGTQKSAHCWHPQRRLHR